MVVMVLERVPAGMRGELSRWMIEPSAGVFVGRISAAVRDRLWKLACREAREGSCLIVYTASNEQGYAVRSYGPTRRHIEDIEGLSLVRLPKGDALFSLTAGVDDEFLAESIAAPAGIDEAEWRVVRALWGKSDPVHPLYCHMIDVGQVAGALLRRTGFRQMIRAFAEASGCPEPDVAAWLMYLCALHDLGKARAAFQGKGPEELVGRIQAAGLHCPNDGTPYRHEAESARWLLDYLPDEAGWSKRPARTICATIRGHHGSFNVKTPSSEGSEAIRAPWERVRSHLGAIMRQVFQPYDWQPDDFKDHTTAGTLLSGLLVFADWIASNHELMPPPPEQPSVAAYADVSAERARGAVDRLGLGHKTAWSPGMSFVGTWREMRQPRPIQSCSERLVKEGMAPGLCILEAPMGEGKTEAGIYVATQWIAATGRSGMYVALPTAATSNQMFARIRQFLAEHDEDASRGAQLVHGTAWLVDDVTPDAAEASTPKWYAESDMALEWFRPRKRSLLAPFGVGTVDQALMAVLNVKHHFLRLFGLARKVVLIDEVHAYDAYMSEILERLLTWCAHLQIPVVLLSATLPEEKRRTLLKAYGAELDVPDTEEASPETAPYPCVTYAPLGSDVALQVGAPATRVGDTIRVKKHAGLLNDPEEVARLVVERSTAGGCHCVIANTIGSAQRIYRAIRERVGDQTDVELLLFHARFPMARRQALEEQALSLFDKGSLLDPNDPDYRPRPERAILVATQVVEQSLDLDFDEMFSEIAPIDLILQRAGRLHRHDRGDRPTGSQARLHILLPPPGDTSFSTSERIYHRFILLKTLAIVYTLDRFHLPGDIRSSIERVYDGAPRVAHEQPNIADADLEQAWEQMKAEDQKLSDAASEYLVPCPDAERFRLSDQGIEPFEEEEEGVSTYFAARTRHGDHTQRVVLLEAGSREIDLLPAAGRAPDREGLRALFARGVNLPRAWLKDATPEEGFALPRTGIRGMRGVTVLILKGGEWRGTDDKGRPFVIRDDEEMGVMQIREEEGA